MTEYDFGPRISASATQFRLWAPLQDEIALAFEEGETLKMERSDDGWHRCEVGSARAGTTYSFILADGLPVPDPASRYQPRDVHGPSEVVDPHAYRWRTNDWGGHSFDDLVLYELHVGAFTQEGTFAAAIDRLDHLKSLGVTGIQIMPVADFPGRRGWGYDGVLPYAPDSSYGRPEELKRLVDEAHARGICAFLDVVYNHFGPDGNYLPLYAPLFTDRHKTPWGNAINYDGNGSRPIREFVIQNAIYWITDFRFDGLRLDAVHAIKDRSQEHLLHELARRVREAAGERHIHLIIENEDNDGSLLERDEGGRPQFFSAQWNDDIHHVLHVAATGETFGYYADYGDEIAKLGRALAEGFVFQGEHMPYRGQKRGTRSGHLPPSAFVSFIQNHDQIGNRALGDRMTASRPGAVLRALAGVYLLSPQVPMIFMGEEWGAEEPFPYFCDFDEELNEKVKLGRRNELSRLPGFDADDLPDPTAEATFLSAKLDWTKLESDNCGQWLDFYRELLALRRQRITPLVTGIIREGGRYHVSAGGGLSVEWTLSGGGRLRLMANLSDRTVEFDEEVVDENPILLVGAFAAGRMAPWSVLWSIVAFRPSSR
ncbi:malto-oligosyltrehalose trehalohydrolase [Rhizobium mesosinicum]|uniref:Malto-oligosyltrehalose trehalohydrolase n=1 Tax=Rhizobium mesosinicum TaxID=335017 RepID=A0ABS7GTC4_9HYPH|nr:malto-oligosyltrehalose trehalohydrolase [Rhizobium mesosinicum]MBW9052464.1 malto-oligosyltrehalose trehalohydrolase [Rhizobium mesosinicum]